MQFTCSEQENFSFKLLFFPIQRFLKQNKGRSKPTFIKPSTSSSPYWFLFIYILYTSNILVFALSMSRFKILTWIDKSDKTISEILFFLA
ncbi:hypothetical protein C1634_018750 [Chryseobacterium viscerum]|uniref:Uncharacterized protein n=1 Tax=Chryseobacterium viscerum TaxID=1037377 RepID=A0A316WD48_9FLAO|nr:hypothetical protein C1634_018750 [Chryseobacterium viscerum]